MTQDLPSRERLLEAATAEFALKGLAGARIHDIAARAGVNKQLVYHYFGSKEGIYAQAIEHVLLRSRVADETLDLEGLPPTEALTSFMEHVVATSLSDMQYQRLMLDANWHRAEHIDGSSSGVRRMRGRVEVLGDILRRGAEGGVFRDNLDPLETYLSIIGALSIRITNAFSLSKTQGADLLTQEGRDRSVARGIDLLMQGIKAA